MSLSDQVIDIPLSHLANDGTALGAAVGGACDHPFILILKLNVLKVVEEIKQVGAKHNASAGRVTLAWLLAQGPHVVPIPGTRK